MVSFWAGTVGNAEKLPARQLEKDKSYLEGRLEEQEKDLEDLQAQLEEVTPERIRAAAQSIRLDTVYFLRGKEAAE